MLLTSTTNQPRQSDARQDPDQVIVEWIQDLLQTHKVKELADILDVSVSVISKIKNGHQRLKASELLKLHEALQAPLPTLGYAREGEDCQRKLPAAGDPAGDPDSATKMFDYAYRRMTALNARKPGTRRATQFELLQQVFHIMETIQQTPEAIDEEAAE